MIGETAGSYRIVSKLSEGGMGAVYRAEHILLGKAAAVKVLLPELSHNRDIVARFFNEAKAATAVRHPGIVEIFDFGYLPSGMAYLVMELLDGETLASRIKRVGRLSEPEACGLVRVVTTALVAAHGQGIVHRDLKPDNIFLVPDAEMASGERPKLLDFGIAKLGGTGTPSASMTRTGAVLGTPTYMSPEQCRGMGEVDHRADLYALGCILYELVTGRPPFVSDAPGDLIAAHIVSAPEPPSRHAPISPELEAIILRLLAKRADDRFSSAAELVSMLAPLCAYTVGRTPPPYGSVVHSTGPHTPYRQHQPTPAPPSSYPGVPPGSYPGATPGSYPGLRTDAPTQIAGAAQTFTTLGAAVGQAEAPPRRRGALTGGIAAAVAAIGVAAVLIVGGGGGKDTPAPPAPPPGQPAAVPPTEKPADPPPIADAPPTEKPADSPPIADAPPTEKPADPPPIADAPPIADVRTGSGAGSSRKTGRRTGKKPGTGSGSGTGAKPGTGSSSSSPVFDDI